MNPDNVKNMAANNGWTHTSSNEQSKVMSFHRDGERVNVYPTTGTVGTCINHPSSGKTQLFRSDQSESSMNQIFDNPRTHTGAGYYRKK